MKKTIAFVYYDYSTFVEQDYNILSKHFEVRKVCFDGIKSVYDIYKAIKWADVSFCCFADVWSFIGVVFAKLFRKKSVVVVVGGYDVACEPQINYGICTKSKLRQWMSRFTINKCDFLLAVSDNIKEDCYKYLKYSRDIFVVNRGHDSNKFKPDVTKSKHNVLTVVSGRDNIIKIKGLNTFTEAAKHFKDVNFIIVGISGKDNRKELKKSNNIFTLEKVSQERLIDYYQHAKVYCQLSLREGLPNSLCEAMLCECVPVGSDCDGVKNVICDTGFCVPYGNVEATVDAIKEALQHKELGKDARMRIKELYNLENRERKLLELLK